MQKFRKMAFFSKTKTYPGLLDFIPISRPGQRGMARFLCGIK